MLLRQGQHCSVHTLHHPGHALVVERRRCVSGGVIVRVPVERRVGDEQRTYLSLLASRARRYCPHRRPSALLRGAACFGEIALATRSGRCGLTRTLTCWPRREFLMLRKIPRSRKDRTR